MCVCVCVCVDGRTDDHEAHVEHDGEAALEEHCIRNVRHLKLVKAEEPRALGRADKIARNVCHLEGAASTEMESSTPHPIVGLITEWLDASGKVEKRDEEADLGGTMRLGGQECRLQEGSLSRQLYGKEVIRERHRHRYEFNNQYLEEMEASGVVSMPEHNGQREVLAPPPPKD